MTLREAIVQVLRDHEVFLSDGYVHYAPWPDEERRSGADCVTILLESIADRIIVEMQKDPDLSMR